ncbi:hypothetical protein RRG08_043779, partial [Elysia crispata]
CLGGILGRPFAPSISHEERGQAGVGPHTARDQGHQRLLSPPSCWTLDPPGPAVLHGDRTEIS